jgi:hypothetical protein
MIMKEIGYLLTGTWFTRTSGGLQSYLPFSPFHPTQHNEEIRLHPGVSSFLGIIVIIVLGIWDSSTNGLMLGTREN